MTEAASVLVVDDDPVNRSMLARSLEANGNRVTTAKDGAEALDKVRSEEFDVVLLDVVMPKRNGFEVLRGLRKDGRTKTTRVIVVSSKNQESDRLWGLRQGADEYLPKPFTPEQLLTAVRRFVR